MPEQGVRANATRIVSSWLMELFGTAMLSSGSRAFAFGQNEDCEFAELSERKKKQYVGELGISTDDKHV